MTREPALGRLTMWDLVRISYLLLLLLGVVAYVIAGLLQGTDGPPPRARVTIPGL